MVTSKNHNPIYSTNNSSKPTNFLVIVEKIYNEKENKGDLFLTLVDIIRKIGDVEIIELSNNSKKKELKEKRSFHFSLTTLKGLLSLIFNSRSEKEIRLIARYIKPLYKSFHILQKSDAKIIALSSCRDTGLFAYLLSKTAKREYYFMEHRADYRWHTPIQNSLEKLAFLNAKKVIFVSPRLKRDVEISMHSQLHHGIVIGNPIPDHFFLEPTYTTLPQNILQLRNKHYIFSTYTLWRTIKRLNLLLKAFSLARKEFNAPCVLLIGGKLSNEALLKTQNYDLSNVYFLGHLTRPQIKELAYLSDCGLTGADYETFALPVAESLAAGKPVIATKCGGPEFIINNPKLGILVDVNDAKGFAKAMNKMTTGEFIVDTEFIKKNCFERFSKSKQSEAWLNVIR